jgi:lysophospholipase L1-like esterase
LLPIVICHPAVAQNQQRSPDKPLAEPFSNARWHRLLEYHRAQLTVRKADVCFMGDSLTEAWQQEGASAWRMMTHGLRAVNCGIAGDRIEHVLYRLQRLDLGRAKPRAVVLWAGTNNLSADQPDTPEGAVRGVMAATKLIKTASPETKIVVLSLAPNGLAIDSPLQRAVKETNRLLAQQVPASDAVFVDLHAALANPDGGWKPDFSLDGTHLSTRGYECVAGVLGPALRALVNSDNP